MTVEELIDECISEVVAAIDADDTRSLNYFKSAIRKLPVFLRSRLFIAEDTLTLSSGTSSLALTGLSPEFIRERSIFIVESSGKRTEIFKTKSPQEFNVYASAGGTGKPAFYKVVGQTIYFDKSADTSYTIKFDYFKGVSDVELDDELAVDEQVIEVIKSLWQANYYRKYEEDKTKADDQDAVAIGMMQNLEINYEQDELGDYVVETE